MKLLVEKLILILAIFSSASGAFAATAARGLVLYTQPPNDAVNALEFVTVSRSNVTFSSVLLPTGERVEIPRGGVVAFIDYPSEAPTVSEAEAAIRTLEAAIPKYPLCTARLRAALTKWNNALAFARQLSRKPVVAPAKVASVPALLVDGVKYADATLSSFDGTSVGIEHANGVAKIAAKQLTPAQITALNATSKALRIDLTRIVEVAVAAAPLEAVKVQAAAVVAAKTGSFADSQVHHQNSATTTMEASEPLKKTEITTPDHASKTETSRPSDPFQQGMNASAKGDYDLAISFFSKVIRDDPKADGAYSNRGVAYKAKADYTKAIADYDQAIRLNPTNARTYANRGLAYKANGDYEKAIADYNESMRLGLKDANVYYGRAHAYKAKRDYGSAIADYDEAIRLNPKIPTIYGDRGNAYLENGNAEKALVDYNEAIRLNPQFAPAYYNRGVFYQAMANYNKAIADYCDAIRLNPKFVPAYFNRGFAYQTTGDYAKAMADYDEALRIDPTCRAAEYSRGVLYRTRSLMQKITLLACFVGTALLGIAGKNFGFFGRRPDPNPKSFSFDCPYCSQLVSTDERECGTPALCPACGDEIIVPAFAPAQEARPPVLVRVSRILRKRWAAIGALLLVTSAFGIAGHWMLAFRRSFSDSGIKSSQNQSMSKYESYEAVYIDDHLASDVAKPTTLSVKTFNIPIERVITYFIQAEFTIKHPNPEQWEANSDALGLHAQFREKNGMLSYVACFTQPGGFKRASGRDFDFLDYLRNETIKKLSVLEFTEIIDPSNALRDQARQAIRKQDDSNERTFEVTVLHPTATVTISEASGVRGFRAEPR